MKRLIKTEPPQVLVEHAGDWTSAYISSGGKSAPWSHEQIKLALITETAGKCAYCEARMLAVSFGDIEHILPKSEFPQLVVAWDNLTLACSRCNSRKSSKYDAKIAFVNPYLDEPSDHLLFLGPMVCERTDRGLYTIHELGLNEMPRVEARIRAIEQVANLVARHQAAPAGYKRQALAELIDKVVQEGEYTAAVSTYVSAVGIPTGTGRN